MKGLDGLQQIQDMMLRLRTTPPQSLAGSAVVRIDDVQESTSRNLTTNTTSTLNLPKSNVLQFILADGSKISARPSGTEPKIKFYFSLKTPFTGAANYGELVKQLDAKIGTIRTELGV
jgi:phosphoglucomutase